CLLDGEIVEEFSDSTGRRCDCSELFGVNFPLNVPSQCFVSHLVHADSSFRGESFHLPVNVAVYAECSRNCVGRPADFGFQSAFKFCHYELSHSIASAIKCKQEDKLGPTLWHPECFSPDREKSRLPLAIYCKRSVYILGAKLCRAYRQHACRLQAERDVPLKCLQRRNGLLKSKMTLAPTRTMLELKPTPVSSSRSVTRTLRLDEDVEAGIVEMAEREQFSFNLLANKALRKLVKWEDKAGKFGFIQVPTSLVEKRISILSDEEARELGREAGTNTLPEMVLFWFKKFNPENALKAMEMIGNYGNAFRLQYTVDGETDTVVLKHDRGPRVSAFYGEMFQSLFKPMGAKVETRETDGQVVATIIRPLTGLA